MAASDPARWLRRWRVSMKHSPSWTRSRQTRWTLALGSRFDLDGEGYARDWALSQFYFHIMTAYAILRNQGVELGKADYVQHMFAYLRPGTAPAS